MNLKYRLIDHTADLGIEAEFHSLKEVFEKCGLILFDLITDLEKIEAKKEINFEIEEENIEDLLIRFLNELIYLYETKHFLASQINVDLKKENKLKATLKGENINLKKHRIKTEIKAATYHDFEFKKEDSKFKVRVIFDI